MVTIKRYRTIIETVDVPKTLMDFKQFAFSTGAYAGPDFKIFARLFRNYIKRNIPVNANIVNFSVGHYYISGFIELNGKFAYFSCSDVRFFVNDWLYHLLIRTAKNARDYTGGSNGYTSLKDFKDNISRLLA